ncbi:hypothetical protein [Nonomuraea sp. NPDC046570]|uniref:hypothetical protein n=1 Tax=Nonomuraea sp. NPDC046570 TaxID=3155255 RepID=UPI0033C71F52
MTAKILITWALIGPPTVRTGSAVPYLPLYHLDLPVGLSASSPGLRGSSRWA